MEILELARSAYETVATLMVQSFARLLISPFRASERIYWLYVLSSVVIALAVYLFARDRDPREDRNLKGIAGFFRFCFPTWVWSHPSAWLDVRYFLFHGVFRGMLILVSGLISVGGIATWVHRELVGPYGTPPLASLAGSEFAAITCTIFLFLFVDLLNYFTHVLQHKVPWLWEFHKIHHSAVVMHPLTNYREHPIDNIASDCTTAVANGIGIGILVSIFEEQHLTKILGLSVFGFLFNFLAYNLRHSHIWLAWPPSIGWIVGSPAHHQLHHSAEPQHRDKNFAFGFTIWDWLFGTLHLPRERDTFPYGLGDGTEAEYSSAVRMYVLPFVKIFQSLRQRVLGT